MVIRLLALLFLLVSFFSCSPDPTPDHLYVTPNVSTSSESITDSSAVIKISIDYNNAKSIGLIYGTELQNKLPKLAQGDTVLTSHINCVSFIVNKLKPDTKYFYCGFVTNGVDTVYGSVQEFRTNPITAPVLSTTIKVSAITTSTASSGGIIEQDGGSPVLMHGLCWGTSPNPTVEGMNLTFSYNMRVFGALTYMASVKKLLPQTTYYIRAFATNEKGISYAPQQVFTTR